MANERRHQAAEGSRGETPRGSRAEGASVVDENVETIKSWERAVLLARSTGELLGDWISRAAASGQGLLLHALWYAVWIGINMGAISGVEPFDPFPFPLLTLILALEAIFLSLFVLASQNRMTRQADQRSHLDLQIDLLAEREMTAVLQLLQDIAHHLKVNTSVTSEELRELINKTDVQHLATRAEELTEPDDATGNAQCPDSPVGDPGKTSRG